MENTESLILVETLSRQGRIHSYKNNSLIRLTYHTERKYYIWHATKMIHNRSYKLELNISCFSNKKLYGRLSQLSPW